MDEDNAFGQKLSETVNYPGFSKTFRYGYDVNGQKRSFSMPDGTTYSYTYDNNELRTIRIPGVGNINYPSYTLGRPDSMSSPGDTRSYAYDALLRLDTLDSSTLEYSYSYDDVGNILTKTTEHGSYTYGYDDVYRLTTVDNPTVDDEAYTYDGVGNRETASGVTGSITHNANNELTIYGDISYDYDANGNMIQKQVGTATVNYIYDATNRLVRVEDDVISTVIAEYYYDPFGRRLWKDVGGERTYFLYADEGLVAEYDESGEEIRSYGYQPNSTWTTDPVWLEENGSYYWYQNDHLGTPQKLVDSAGTVVWDALYTAFGEAQISIETVTNNLRFPGQYFDAETGLYYNFHRYYDPGVGRYLQVDPIGFDGGNVNLYEYVLSNPLNNRDPQSLRVDEPGKPEACEQEEECCQVEWPKSPVKEIALMCYAESSPPYKCSDQNEREKEKRAMTDTVYNRMKKDRPHWGGSDAIDVLKKKGQYLAYGNAKYLDAETPDNLSDEACQELKACIKAAKASAISQKYTYTQFDQSSKSFKGHKHTKICVHYFRTLER